MTWHRNGTVALTAGLREVTGTGTLWLAGGVRPGDLLTLDEGGSFAEVASVEGQGALTLRRPWAGESGAGLAYAIVRNFTSTLPAELAARLSGVLGRWQANQDQFAAWLGGSATGGPEGDGRYPLTDALGDTRLLECPARLLVLVEGLVDAVVASVIADVEAHAAAAVAGGVAAETARDDAQTAQTQAQAAATDAATFAGGAQTAAAAAATSASSASGSASTATAGATDAAASAAAAGIARDTAQAARGAAEAARDVAQSHRNLASEWASNAEDAPISGNPGQFSARHWSAKAAQSAAGLNLPAVVAGSAGRTLQVNAAGTGFELSGGLRVTASGQVQAGAQAITNSQTDAYLSVRKGGNGMEFGNGNAAGYGSTLGGEASSGIPYLAFHAEAGSAANTYRTRGLKGSLLRSDLDGGFTFATLGTAGADNQTPTRLGAWTGSGRLEVGAGAGPLINDTRTVATFRHPSNGQATSVAVVDGSGATDLFAYVTSAEAILGTGFSKPLSLRTGNANAVEINTLQQVTLPRQPGATMHYAGTAQWNTITNAVWNKIPVNAVAKETGFNSGGQSNFDAGNWGYWTPSAGWYLVHFSAYLNFTVTGSAYVGIAVNGDVGYMRGAATYKAVASVPNNTGTVGAHATELIYVPAGGLICGYLYGNAGTCQYYTTYTNLHVLKVA